MTFEDVPTSAGLSSFNLLDEKQLFAGLALQPGMTMLDFACGVGNYAIAASPYIGANGRIYAVDPWEEGVETLEIRASMARLVNIEAYVCGAGDRLPIDDQVVDLCLLATIVHILDQEKKFEKTMTEIKRVLKPGGRIAVVEFHKKEGPPGPPFSWRLAPETLERIVASSGFIPEQVMDVGPHNYLTLFRPVLR